MQYQKIINIIKNSPDGCTIDQRGLKYLPNNGYFIAISDHQTKKITPRMLKNLSKTAHSLSLPGYSWYIGSWRDEKTGLYYIDITLFTAQKSAAVILAKIFMQKAIFDCRNLKSLYIN